jgi:hypothetical protein
MYVILASEGEGMFIAAILLFGGYAASLLALAALVPALRGNRTSTYKMIAPAVIVTLVFMVLVVGGFVEALYNSYYNNGKLLDRLLDLLMGLVFYASAPLITSVLAFIVLRYRNRKGIEE